MLMGFGVCRSLGREAGQATVIPIGQPGHPSDSRLRLGQAPWDREGAIVTVLPTARQLAELAGR